MRWCRRNRAVAVLGMVTIVMALASPPTPAAPLESRAGASTIDYLHAPFQTRWVLDWGDRPNWSPDGTRLAFTESDTEDGLAYELDLDTGGVRCLTCRWGPSGLVTRIYHLFPDERFGLEESNRASDPNGPLRGVSGLAASAPGIGGAFDLFVVALDDPKQIRRLTDVSDLGGQANQSVPAPDGRRIAFVVDAPPSGPYAGKDGLHVGEFLIDRCAKDGQRRAVPTTYAGVTGGQSPPARSTSPTCGAT